MSPGDYAQAALASVLSQLVKDEVAMLVITVDQSGNVYIVTNARDKSDVPHILRAALDANANPDWTSDGIPPAKA